MTTADSDPWRQMVLDGLARIERRLDGLVTTETHAADMRRVDDRLTDLAADIGQERAMRAEQQAKLDARLEQLAAALATEAESRRKGDEADLATVRTEIAAEAASRKRDRQWLVASIIAVLGVIVAAAQVMLR